MTDQFAKQWRKLEPLSVPAGLTSLIESRLRSLTRQRARRNLLVYIGLFAGSMLALIPISVSLYQSFAVSGLGLVSGFFATEGVAMINDWRELLWWLGESLPWLSLATLLGCLALGLWSLARMDTTWHTRQSLAIN